MASLPEGDFATVRAAVESSFRVQELWFQDGRPIFTVVPSADDKERFLRLRQALDGLGLLPLLRKQSGETVLVFVPKPQAGRTRWLLPVGLFVATLGTTFWAGTQMSQGGCIPAFLPPLAGGAAFSLSLMAILFCHEMGHKVVSIWRGIDSSLPFFIPLPPLVPGLSIGTMGAVILTRTPAPNRDALIELGASGPIAGFLVTVPILIYGIRHSLVIAHAAILGQGCQLVSIPSPLLFDVMARWMLHPGPSAEVVMHPVAFAAWVGLFVTALNLLPASMLDGGHVMRAVFGPKIHMIMSYIAVGVGLVLGYWFMSLLILLMIRRGHPGPLDDCSPVTFAHKAMAAVLVVIFALSAAPLTIF